MHLVRGRLRLEKELKPRKKNFEGNTKKKISKTINNTQR